MNSIFLAFMAYFSFFVIILNKMEKNIHISACLPPNKLNSLLSSWLKYSFLWKVFLHLWMSWSFHSPDPVGLISINAWIYPVLALSLIFLCPWDLGWQKKNIYKDSSFSQLFILQNPNGQWNHLKWNCSFWNLGHKFYVNCGIKYHANLLSII